MIVKSYKKNWIIYLIIAVNIFIIISMILAIPIGLYVFYNEYIELTNTTDGKFPLFILGLPFFNLTNLNYLITFCTMSVVYLALLLSIIFKERKSLEKSIKKRMDLKVVLSNRIIIIPAAYSMLTIVSFIIEKIQNQIGIETGVLSSRDPVTELLSLSISPISEEIGFRASIIGLITFIIVSQKNSSKDVIKSFLYPEQSILTNKNNNKHDYVKLLYVIAFISGIYFGIAHIIYGGEWQLGKITTASLAGITLGIIYIKFGLVSSILIHWSFNYYTTVYIKIDAILGSINLIYIIDFLIITNSFLITLYFITNKFLFKKNEE